MFKFFNGAATAHRGVLTALGKALAIIEFRPDGTILTANENFCATMGYAVSELKGRHHSMFVEPGYAASDEYKVFWTKLGRGKFDAGEYKRLGNGGKQVWIQASYNPVLKRNGQVLKVVKVAADVTADKLRNAEFESKLNAVSRAQAVIEFTCDGTIASANPNFLAAVGYSLEEVVGQHHRMFVDPDEAKTPAYQDFWRRLNQGEFIAAEFRRVGKGGKEIWINASYNPVFDLNANVSRIVKFATVVTERVIAVKEIQSGLNHLAGNDLVYRLKRPLDREFEPVRSDFNASIQGLQSAVKRVSTSAYAIQSGALEIGRASDDLSRRTEHQAATLEETAAALDEVTTTVRQTAEGARQATQQATLARKDAAQSSGVMREAIAAMDRIEQSSSKVSQIIGVIDEIAFQTNLLALNAGVEAARAGNAGRGFAFVAQEVRVLAQRSAEAAKEIKTLIGVSSANVSHGVELVGQTGHALKGIADKVSDMEALISQISASATEQASGLTEVNASINQMDQATQQNAAMVEEVTAAVASLRSEADRMTSLMSDFKTDAADGRSSTVPAERGSGVRRHAGPSKVVALRTAAG